MLCAIIIFTFPTELRALEMKSLETILREEKTLPTVSVMLLRCRNLLQISAKYPQSQSDPRSQSLGKKYEKHTNEILVLWQALEKILSPGTKPNTDFFLKQSEIMIAEYTKLLSRSKALTGHMFEDEIVSSDMKTK